MDEDPSSDRKRKEEVIAKFRKCFGDAKDYWSPIYKRSAQRRKFTLLGQQLESREAKAYGMNRPMMPNMLLTYVNNEANKTLQTDYVAKVTPNGFGANELAAEAREEVLRGTQRMGNISQVFNFTRRDQIATGIAYSQTKIDYAEKRGFGKTIKPKYMENTYKVLPDPNVQTATFSDAEYWIVEEEVPIEKWKAETGIDPSFTGGQKKKKLWHYWVKEGNGDTEYLMDGGKETKLKSELIAAPEKDAYGNPVGESPDMAGVAMDEMGRPLERPVADFHWKWYKITEEYEVVDEEEWLGSHSPITACIGRKVVDENGQVYYQAMTEFAEVPQKVFTILYNILCLRLGKSPFSKWKIPFESILQKQLEDLRRSATVGDLDIIWKAFTDDGKQIPPPEEIEPQIIDPTIIALMNQQVVEIQRIFGIFESDLQEQGRDRSGVAIRELKASWSVANYDYLFNFLEYVEQVGRVMLDLIPKYLTAPQQVAFIDRENKAVIDWINTEGSMAFNPDEEYTLAIEAVPTAETARKEEAEFLSHTAEISPLVAQNPQAMALVIRAQPGRAAQALAEIIGGSDPKLQQAQALIGKLQKELQDTTEAAQAKIIQNAVQNEALQGVIKLMREQMQLLRVAHQADKAASKESSDINPMLSAMDAQMKALELQIDKQEADTNAQQANNESVRVASEALNPKQPKNVKLTGGFPERTPSRMFQVK